MPRPLTRSITPRPSGTPSANPVKGSAPWCDVAPSTAPVAFDGLLASVDIAPRTPPLAVVATPLRPLGAAVLAVSAADDCAPVCTDVCPDADAVSGPPA